MKTPMIYESQAGCFQLTVTPILPLASPTWMRAVPLDFFSSAALTVGTVPHSHILLFLPDPRREKGDLSLQVLCREWMAAQHPHGDLGLPPQVPWASCP